VLIPAGREDHGFDPEQGVTLFNCSRPKASLLPPRATCRPAELSANLYRLFALGGSMYATPGQLGPPDTQH